MVRKKVDNRLRVLIENGISLNHRTMFVIVGDKGRDQVVILHHMLTKATVKSRPSILWCYKKELGFSSHRKKRMKNLQQKIKAGKLNVNEDDPFELFVASTTIRYCYYNETHKILGNTYGMCVLQDFEALTPNLLARTIETVEGGGIIVILLRTVSSLKQLYTMTMDIHERYRTEAHTDIVGRFNERFLLSLSENERCLVVDDQLTVLPISSLTLQIQQVAKKSVTADDDQLNELKESLKDTQPVSALLNCCKTLDQGKALLKFIEAISEKSLRSTVSLTAARGRGKSAALGLAMSAAVAFGYSNIFVTSPSPENLNTLFEFIFKGFDALEYQEHLDYDLIQSTNPDFNKAIVRVNVFREHRQTIQYIHPSDAHKLGQAELVVIDEAAAIPLPLVKSMLGPYLVFLASTINGYEGTGRSLSLKLLQQLRTQTASVTGSESTSTKQDGTSRNTATGRVLHEVTLDESIRYSQGDVIERWLCSLLCLDITTHLSLLPQCPPPDLCELYYINRDALFSYHKASESFLQRLVSLYVASHYKNTPNDLQMMSDAPSHHLFCLLPPVDHNKITIPDILVVIQVCLEGRISKQSASDKISRGRKAAGDLIPWTISQQFQDNEFPSLSGARIIRIATHPDYQGMGYGSRALNILHDYYEHKIQNIDENDLPVTHISPTDDENLGLLKERIGTRKSVPSLLSKLSEHPPEVLDYLGVSFGLTQSLLKFWKRSGYIPVYLRQTQNDLTGEHSCIMLKVLSQEDRPVSDWLNEYWFDFKKRFITLLGYQFRQFTPALALSVLQNKSCPKNPQALTKDHLDTLFSSYDMRRFEMYSNNLVDYHLIMDLLPALSRVYFTELMGDVHFSAVQSAILLGLGLQHKTVDQLATELDLPASQLLGLFNRSIRRALSFFNTILENSVEEELGLGPQRGADMLPSAVTVDQELEEAAKKLKQQQKEELKKLQHENLSQYVIKGSEEEWGRALSTSGKNIVSVKSVEKRKKEVGTPEKSVKKKKKTFKKE